VWCRPGVMDGPIVHPALVGIITESNDRAFFFVGP
jgi:hypothetical protein